MADEGEKTPFHITVGKVIANTAMVAGVVALGVAIASATGLIGGSSTPTETGQESWLAKGFRLGFDLKDIDPARTAVFAGAVGVGGYALSSAMHGKAQDIANEQAEQDALNTVHGGHAAKIETAAIQGVTKARMLATNPEYFAQLAPTRSV